MARVGEMARLIDAGLAICSIFGEGGSWGGGIDSGGSCGVVFNVSNRFGAPLAGARFFFGFRPRLLGIGKQYAPRLNNTASTAAARRHPPSRVRHGRRQYACRNPCGSCTFFTPQLKREQSLLPRFGQIVGLMAPIQMDFGPDGFRGSSFTTPASQSGLHWLTSGGRSKCRDTVAFAECLGVRVPKLAVESTFLPFVSERRAIAWRSGARRPPAESSDQTPARTATCAAAGSRR